MYLFKWIFSSDDSDQEQDDGDNEKDMDKPSNRVDTYDAQEPEDQKNDCNCS